MPSEIVTKINEITVPVVERNNAFIVDINVRGERSSKVVEVFVDSDKGISLEECSTISRELSGKLDEANIIQSRYRLDVSSPGLDKPLKLQRQYIKNVGRNCKIFLKENGNNVTIEGVLEKVDDNVITVLSKGKPTAITFTDIIETYIVPKFK